MYRIWYTGRKPKPLTGVGTQPKVLERRGKRVPAIFFRTEAGGEPVRHNPRIGNSSVRTLRRSSLAGRLECPFADHWVMAFMKCGRAWSRTELLGYFFTSTRKVDGPATRIYQEDTNDPAEDLELARSNKGKHQRGLQ